MAYSKAFNGNPSLVNGLKGCLKFTLQTCVKKLHLMKIWGQATVSSAQNGSKDPNWRKCKLAISVINKI